LEWGGGKLGRRREGNSGEGAEMRWGGDVLREGEKVTYCPVSQRERERASEQKGESNRERAKQREGDLMSSVRRFDNRCRAGVRATAPSLPMALELRGRERGMCACALSENKEQGVEERGGKDKVRRLQIFYAHSVSKPREPRGPACTQKRYVYCTYSIVIPRLRSRVSSSVSDCKAAARAVAPEASMEFSLRRARRERDAQ
jgi:hypothetical protein